MSLYIRNEQLIRADGFTAKLISDSTTTDDTITSSTAYAIIVDAKRSSPTNGSQSIVAEYVAILTGSAINAIEQPKPS